MQCYLLNPIRIIFGLPGPITMRDGPELNAFVSLIYWLGVETGSYATVGVDVKWERDI